MLEYFRKNKIISGTLDDELIMMDIDKGKYFALNPVAKRIWELLSEPLTINDICSVLINEYEISKEKCIEEVEKYITELVKLNLVTSRKI